MVVALAAIVTAKSSNPEIDFDHSFHLAHSSAFEVVDLVATHGVGLPVRHLNSIWHTAGSVAIANSTIAFTNATCSSH